MDAFLIAFLVAYGCFCALSLKMNRDLFITTCIVSVICGVLAFLLFTAGWYLAGIPLKDVLFMSTGSSIMITLFLTVYIFTMKR